MTVAGAASAVAASTSSSDFLMKQLSTMVPVSSPISATTGAANVVVAEVVGSIVLPLLMVTLVDRASSSPSLSSPSSHPSSTGTTNRRLINNLRGGGRSGGVSVKSSPPIKTSLKSAGETKSTGLFGITPQGRSVMWMAIGMACHYLGYSLARPITVALFTSSQTGYPGSPGAFAFANAFISPVSIMLLLTYGNVLEKFGPRGALTRSTLGCALLLLLTSAGIEVSINSGLQLAGIPFTKFLSGPLFVFRESYVQLLTSQYWSFMASVLTPNQSAKWFAPIAGLTSISSVIGGTAVKYLTKKLHLAGTLSCTGFALVVSLIATNAAYKIAEDNGFNPAQRVKTKIQQATTVQRHVKRAGKAADTINKHHQKIQKKIDQIKKKEQEAETKKKNGTLEMIEKARKLFDRVPVLRALFLEILASQGLATLLNMCFVTSVGASIPDDQERAGWVGNYYALINVGSMTLQFLVLPQLMRVMEPKVLWRLTPLISLGFTTWQAIQKTPTLYMISASLLVMKVLEYSARRMLDEMVYVPLDYESRFVGKEIIGVFGYRFGKSLISLSMSIATSVVGQFDLHSLSILCDVTAFAWAKTAWDLSALVPTRKQATEQFEKRTTKDKR
mmetsp:Transcript_51502/g.124361  ORF Transcript_51502/g.124361 Transcript_51502/m.124361 type:complete len:617 (+) Transcript_51502:95-1945(+)